MFECTIRTLGAGLPQDQNSPHKVHFFAHRAYLFTTWPFRLIKNLVKFHLIPSVTNPPCSFFRKFQKGSASSPFTFTCNKIHRRGYVLYRLSRVSLLEKATTSLKGEPKKHLPFHTGLARNWIFPWRTWWCQPHKTAPIEDTFGI